jgi:hypothetical protein
MKNIKINRIERFGDFILEKVYLYKTIFSKYNLIVDPLSKVGHFNLDVRGFGDVKLEIEKYGKDGNIFIIRNPNINIDDELNIFKNIINDIIYILNKNRLDYKFNLIEVKKETQLDIYALIECDMDINIGELEKISQTTKIVNAKVTDKEDLDKLVYKTSGGGVSSYKK